MKDRRGKVLWSRGYYTPPPSPPPPPPPQKQHNMLFCHYTTCTIYPSCTYRLLVVALVLFLACQVKIPIDTYRKKSLALNVELLLKNQQWWPPNVNASSFDITSTYVESIAMTTQMGPWVNTYTELTLCRCNYKSPITIAILSYTILMVVERTEIWYWRHTWIC